MNTVIVKEIIVSTAASRSGIADLDYALNPYVGCMHGCLYCYARVYTKYREVAERWGSVVYVKKNICSVLRRELSKLRGVVGIGTITDPYQPIEDLYRLTRSMLKMLLKSSARVSIQTKSYRVVEDIEILKMFGDRVDVGITITSTENYFAKKFEPYASPPSLRIEALRKLSEEGIKTWIFLGPIIPGENDDLKIIEEIVRLARETNSILYIDKLRIKKFMLKSDVLASIIARTDRYDWASLQRRIEELAHRYGVVLKSEFGYEYRSDVAKTTLYSYVGKK